MVDTCPAWSSPELYTRWLQFGAFSPILRTHTTKNPDAERRIWAYPEPYADIMRGVYHLRYALLPYIYTESRQHLRQLALPSCIRSTMTGLRPMRLIPTRTNTSSART